MQAESSEEVEEVSPMDKDPAAPAEDARVEIRSQNIELEPLFEEVQNDIEEEVSSEEGGVSSSEEEGGVSSSEEYYGDSDEEGSASEEYYYTDEEEYEEYEEGSGSGDYYEDDEEEEYEYEEPVYDEPAPSQSLNHETRQQFETRRDYRPLPVPESRFGGSEAGRPAPAETTRSFVAEEEGGGSGRPTSGRVVERSRSSYRPASLSEFSGRPSPPIGRTRSSFRPSEAEETSYDYESPAASDGGAGEVDYDHWAIQRMVDDVEIMKVKKN